MSYCANSPKATVNYKFASGEMKKYTTEKVPIEIVTFEKFAPNFLGGQCLVRYLVNWQCNYQALQDCSRATSTGDSIYLLGSIQGIGWEFAFKGDPNYNADSGDAATLYIYHGNNQKYQALGTSGAICANKSAYSASISSVQRADNQPDNCGDPKKYCEINIKHKGLVIFADQGECPCAFEVICGDCPEGTMRCEEPGYPGFCCLPCPPVAQRINNLAARL